MDRTADEIKKEVDELVDRGKELRHEADRLVTQLSESLERTKRQIAPQRRRRTDRRVGLD